MRPLLIGEAPGRTGAEGTLLGRSGRRMSSWLGITLDEFAARFERVNVLRGWPGSGTGGKGARFPAAEARRAASGMRMHGTTVFLGRRVASAFGHRNAAFFRWFEVAGCRCCVIPHPSGVNRAYNDAAVVDAARRVLLDAAGS